jgi:hypothetical protein
MNGKVKVAAVFAALLDCGRHIGQTRTAVICPPNATAILHIFDAKWMIGKL